MEKSKVEKLKYPRKIAIGFREGVCPLNCPKCYGFGKYAKQEKKVGIMELGRARRLIDEIASFDEKVIIQPYLFAEPFANPDLKEIIRYCSERGVGMSIITNGILVDDQWEDFILTQMKENYSVSFSLDAVSQEVYEKVRGPYKLGDIEEKIARLLERRSNGTPRISVNFIVEPDNETEAPLFLDKWKNIADAVGIGTALDKDKKIPDKYKAGGDKTDDYEPCIMPFEVMAIDYDGSVRACSMDAFGQSNLRNVFDSSIEEIWNSGQFNRFRERMRGSALLKTEFCYGCDGSRIHNLSSVDTDEFLIRRGKNYAFYNRKKR